MIWLGLVLVVVVAGVLWQLSHQGPAKVVTAVRRYGVLSYALVLAGALSLALCALLPASREPVVLCWLVLVAWSFWSGRARWLKLRLSWPSTARSCGLAVTKDVRGRSWPFDATITIGNEHIEYLPVINRPRATNDGVRYRLIPAKGSTITEVAERAESLAAGLKVQKVTVVRETPYKGWVEFSW